MVQTLTHLSGFTVILALGFFAVKFMSTMLNSDTFKLPYKLMLVTYALVLIAYVIEPNLVDVLVPILGVAVCTAPMIVSVAAYQNVPKFGHHLTVAEFMRVMNPTFTMFMLTTTITLYLALMNPESLFNSPLILVGFSFITVILVSDYVIQFIKRKSLTN